MNTSTQQAFGISEEDVENVLNSARRWEKTILPRRHDAMKNRATPAPSDLSLEELAHLLYRRLDLDTVAVRALDGGTEMDAQTNAAYDEIERQLNAMDPRILTEGYFPPMDTETLDERASLPIESFHSGQIPAELVNPHLLAHVAKRVAWLFGRPESVDVVRSYLIGQARLFADSPQGLQARVEQRELREVTSSYELEAALERRRAGVHELSAGLEDLPFAGCPEAWGDKPFGRIVWLENKGDSSVGMPDISGWSLAEDQSGTVVADLARSAQQDSDPVAAPMSMYRVHDAIGALYEEMDRAGYLTSEAKDVQYQLLRLRREAAAVSGLPDAAASAAFWQAKIDTRWEPAERTRERRGDAPSA